MRVEKTTRVDKDERINNKGKKRREIRVASLLVAMKV